VSPPRPRSQGPLEIDDGDIPSLDVATLGAQGLRALQIRTPQHLSVDRAPSTLAFVRLLRDAMSLGVATNWHGSIDSRLDPYLLHHLPPPTDCNPAFDNWRSRHRPGLCYYRRGPGFVNVKDLRFADAAVRFSIDVDDHDGDGDDPITALEGVCAVPALSRRGRSLLDELADQRLALQLGDIATLLPYRMRRWPIPSLEV
jgi:hypothetical protein